MGMDWRKKLLEEGFLEVRAFRIELTLDNTFLDLDYIPRVIIYDYERERWYVLRNPIPKGKTLEEGWRNAVEVLGRIAEGSEEALLPDPDLARKFAEVLGKLHGDSTKW